jgi:hypothetical protein
MRGVKQLRLEATAIYRTERSMKQGGRGAVQFRGVTGLDTMVGNYVRNQGNDQLAPRSRQVAALKEAADDPQIAKHGDFTLQVRIDFLD